jgi:hypothetical protein
MSLIVAVVAASLAGSFLCSLCEAALYGVTPTQVEVLRRGRVPGSSPSCKKSLVAASDLFLRFARLRTSSPGRPNGRWSETTFLRQRADWP